MYGGLWNDVHVEAVAEIDGVDVIAFKIGVHDGEEDLKEQVYGIEKYGEQEQPVMDVSVMFRSLPQT